jgi:hypothetical protein
MEFSGAPSSSEGISECPAVRPKTSGCPFSNLHAVQQWSNDHLLCSAGKREMKLGRYMIGHPGDGVTYRAEIDRFVEEARAHRKTGYLAVLAAPEFRQARSVREELDVIARIVAAAGLIATPEAAFSGEEICLPVAMACPVTNRTEIYSFFPVSFCRNAANLDDPLYDPSLSTPFTAINTTSDAFAFAMFVADRSRARHGCAPYEIDDAITVKRLLDWAVGAWQGMSVNTISSFARVAGRADRAVSLSADNQYWLAPHSDPAFAEKEKAMHAHEMPMLYGRALADKWLARMFGDEAVRIDREGQAGGMLVEALSVIGEPSHELQ